MHAAPIPMLQLREEAALQDNTAGQLSLPPLAVLNEPQQASVPDAKLGSTEQDHDELLNDDASDVNDEEDQDDSETRNHLAKRGLLSDTVPKALEELGQGGPSASAEASRALDRPSQATPASAATQANYGQEASLLEVGAQPPKRGSKRARGSNNKAKVSANVST